MSKHKKICVITGTRAEYGLLFWLMREVEADPELALQVVVTGTHLSPEYGNTYQQIEKDGFQITGKVEMLMSSDREVGIAKSLGMGTIGFADLFDRIKPDLIIVLGDRYEILAAVQVALVLNIPIAHIGGGDSTEGVFDEAIRHSITKMSHLHFVTHLLAEMRVKQLGENPNYIYPVGHLGLDYINQMKFIDKKELEKALSFHFLKKNLLITFHPTTLSSEDSIRSFQELLNALELLGSNIGLIFTKPNADTNGRILAGMMEEFVRNHLNAKAFTNLGQQIYLSTMSVVDAVVGNSSSGIYEAPALKIPTVNIGDRQKGRVMAKSVIQSEPNKNAIWLALNKAFQTDCSNIFHPYGDGHSAKRIIKKIKEIKDYRLLLKKHFYMMGEEND